MNEELITRLEIEEGADRELDLEIWNAIYPDEANPVAPVRSFTGSLDAARTLILPGHSFGGLSQVSPHDWIMMIFSRTDSRTRWEGEAATAELAVCVAALKARSAP